MKTRCFSRKEIRERVAGRMRRRKHASGRETRTRRGREASTAAAARSRRRKGANQSEGRRGQRDWQAHRTRSGLRVPELAIEVEGRIPNRRALIPDCSGACCRGLRSSGERRNGLPHRSEKHGVGRGRGLAYNHSVCGLGAGACDQREYTLNPESSRAPAPPLEPGLRVAKARPASPRARRVARRASSALQHESGACGCRRDSSRNLSEGDAGQSSSSARKIDSRTATSSRSRTRPAARLRARRSSRHTTGALVPASGTSTRRSHA